MDPVTDLLAQLVSSGVVGLVAALFLKLWREASAKIDQLQQAAIDRERQHSESLRAVVEETNETADQLERVVDILSRNHGNQSNGKGRQ